MKRRSFLKGITLGAAAATAPARAISHVAEPKAGAEPSRVETFSQQARVRSGMALGGIGAGSIELRKDGKFYNWSIFNNLPKETGPSLQLPEGRGEDAIGSNLFFKLRYEVEGEEPRIKLLQLSDMMNEGAVLNLPATFPWMEAVDQIQYAARFPFAKLTFNDAQMPFTIEMEAWSPFIPHDVKNSSLPIAYFDFSIISKTSKPLHLMLMMSARNCAGYETDDRYYTTDVVKKDSLLAVTMGAGGMDEQSPTWGQATLASLTSDSTFYCGWQHPHPYYQQVLRNRVLPNIDDTNGVESIAPPVPAWMPITHGRNRTDPATGKKKVHDTDLYSTIAKSFELTRTQSRVSHSFVYTWNFPNLYAENATHAMSSINEGHYYSNFFSSSLEVANYAAEQRSDLKKRSREFLDNFFDSSAETFVLEQVNSHLNTFVTSGRLVKDGSFGMLEGLSATKSWGPIATIDVMLYGTCPIIALFPELQKATMRCHRKVQSSRGEVSHGLYKNFGLTEDNTAGIHHRLDLPGQYVMLILRDFFWTDDRQYLNDLYPSIKRAIDYVITYRSFSGDQIPIMRGIESSYDNFPMYGYAVYLLSQWTCALAFAAEAAQIVGDAESQRKYESILEKTRKRMQEKLWNGTYYDLYNDTDKAGTNGARSNACLTDQLIGQWMASQCGFGELLEGANIDSAAKAILNLNYQPEFGLRNCTWPGAKFWSDVSPNVWGDQGNTCWTGVELAFASLLLYRGFYSEAMRVIKSVDDRYRKNQLYWSHQEFGGHYFRPLSSWSIINGLLGFSIHRNTLRFDPKLTLASFKLFFATPTGTAQFLRSRERTTLRCLTGTLNFTTVEIKGAFRGQTIAPGGVAHFAFHEDGEFSKWAWEESVVLEAHKTIVFL